MNEIEYVYIENSDFIRYKIYEKVYEYILNQIFKSFLSYKYPTISRKIHFDHINKLITM